MLTGQSKKDHLVVPNELDEEADDLGIGKLEKRAVVVEQAGEDRVVIQPRCYVTLTIDHRVVDGHQTNAWLTRFVEILESWPAG